MIEIKKLIKILDNTKINFFSGVPDSVLKKFSNLIDKKKNHFVAVNEGSAVAMGIGYHLSTQKIPCVYFQNSGLGNAINPLVSIAHDNVYSIPILLIIGWRGSPKFNDDEPQHNVKGKITLKLLKLLKIKTLILRNNQDIKKIKSLINYSKKNNRPVACLIEKNTLVGNKKKTIKNNKFLIDRFNFIENLLFKIEKKSKIIATTGFTSRELYQLRKYKKFLNKGKDFYMVGGMGHSAMVSSIISKFFKGKSYCLDGDGSFLMHLGSIFTAANIASSKFKYILLNNNVHESVGSQKTFIEKINLKDFSKSLKFKNYHLIKNPKKMQKKINSFIKCKGPSFLEVRIKNKSINDLERPRNLIKIKKNFMSN